MREPVCCSRPAPGSSRLAPGSPGSSPGRSTGRRCLLRLKHGVHRRLRKQRLAAGHEMKHPPQHQFDENPGDKESDEEPQNAARAQVSPLVVHLRIAQRIVIGVVSGHVPILGAGNSVSAGHTAATAAVAGSCRRSTSAISHRARGGPARTRCSNRNGRVRGQS